MIEPLFVITDTQGFTTCCRALREDLNKEAARVSFLYPITVYHWHFLQRDAQMWWLKETFILEGVA